MARSIPTPPENWVKPKPFQDNVHTFEIELITPIFGGGVSTRVNDPDFPIRPTSIRGQLQFWWRATVGAECETLRELRKKQTEPTPAPVPRIVKPRSKT